VLIAPNATTYREQNTSPALKQVEDPVIAFPRSWACNLFSLLVRKFCLSTRVWSRVQEHARVTLEGSGNQVEETNGARGFAPMRGSDQLPNNSPPNLRSTGGWHVFVCRPVFVSSHSACDPTPRDADASHRGGPFMQQATAEQDVLIQAPGEDV
jgi:hypothetical protein